MLSTEVPVAFHCCPLGQAVLKNSSLCWDPSTNTTSHVALGCINVVNLWKHFNLTEDGQMELQFRSNYHQTVEREDFCMGNITKISDVSLNQTRLGMLLCTGDVEPIVDEAVVGYCMIVSVIFLTITTLIYALLPEMRDLQGKSFINFCGSLTIGLIVLVTMKIMEYSDMALCATRGFLAYFFMLAAFFWTNAISIQILINTRRPCVFDYSWTTFKWYALYAWGCPTVLTVCMAIVNFHPYLEIESKPGIGLMHCWFFNKTQQWYYFYSVMTLLLSANIGIFIYTSVLLWRATLSSSHVRALRYKFMMSVRLIILMGLPWVFEMVGSLGGRHIIWTILDMFNVLQGFLIFMLLVVFRRRVIKAMHKHGWLNCVSGLVEKHLAVQDDAENVVEHTDLPMNDSVAPNGRQK